ncbi:MAG: MOSC domain-containing protein [Dehalococcoidales bacterium]|nr:MOSC domain-containing protein [Dehalococcoidales bacterium]
MNGSVVAVCVSKKKGTSKQPVPEIAVKENYGVVGDAHAEEGAVRQVSLLAMESIARMQGKGFSFKPGDFAENITTQGIDLARLAIGARLRVGGEVVLEVSQIGKECHTACAVRRLVGDCIMPREGIFARVIRGGRIRPEDPVAVIGKTPGG